MALTSAAIARDGRILEDVDPKRNAGTLESLLVGGFGDLGSSEERHGRSKHDGSVVPSLCKHGWETTMVSNPGLGLI
ncbi:hypothetical protein [Agrobacterium tumefaciens]|uniref:hypothetical protein n=1 Tax=Agrobacterium tumefaciens TaxID=358 RepID=UPI00220A4B0E|nr:hypothetical protein FY157_23760 [Agrobacterium tumefaciens]